MLFVREFEGAVGPIELGRDKSSASNVGCWAHVWTVRVGKDFLHECSIGRCSHVFGL